MSSGYPKMDVYNETPYLVFVKSFFYLYTIRYDKVMRCKQAGTTTFFDGRSFNDTCIEMLRSRIIKRPRTVLLFSRPIYYCNEI